MLSISLQWRLWSLKKTLTSMVWFPNIGNDVRRKRPKRLSRKSERRAIFCFCIGSYRTGCRFFFQASFHPFCTGGAPWIEKETSIGHEAGLAPPGNTTTKLLTSPMFLVHLDVVWRDLWRSRRVFLARYVPVDACPGWGMSRMRIWRSGTSKLMPNERSMIDRSMLTWSLRIFREQLSRPTTCRIRAPCPVGTRSGTYHVDFYMCVESLPCTPMYPIVYIVHSTARNTWEII